MSGEKDLALKMKVASLFWATGYHFRVGVRLSDYEPGGRKPLELTDLDVLALKVHSDFLIDFIVADCKSSLKNTSPITRAFWLRGVMDYFRARYGYVVTAKAMEEVHKIAARRLSVTLLTDGELDRLLGQAADSQLLTSELFQKSSWEYYEQGLSQLSRDLQGLLRFRNYDFWLNDMGQNPLSTVGAVRRHRALLNAQPRSKFHRALAIDLLSLFGISLLHLATIVYTTSPADVEEGVRAVLSGGAFSLKRKQSMIDTVKKLISELTKDDVVIATLDRRLDLDPPYFRDILDVCLRIASRPVDAASILRYYQAMLFEKVLYPNSKGIALSSVGITPIGVKLAKDIALLLEKASGLNPDLFGPLMGFENYGLTSNNLKGNQFHMKKFKEETGRFNNAQGSQGKSELPAPKSSEGIQTAEPADTSTDRLASSGTKSKAELGSDKTTEDSSQISLFEKVKESAAGEDEHRINQAKVSSEETKS